MICKKCHEHIFERSNECKCTEFIVKDENGDDHSVYANDEESAALKFAQDYNESGDERLTNKFMVITVNNTQWRISAETDINYYADSIDGTEDR